MPKTRIGVDIDDVAIEFNEGLKNYHNLRYGTTYELKDITCHELGLVWGCEPDEVRKRMSDFHHSDEHANLLPMKNTTQTL